MSKADERIKELAEERERSQETRRSIENQIQSTQVAVTKAKEATDREILEKEKAMLNLKKTHAKLRQELSQSAQIKLAADKLATELETSQAQAKKELESQSQEMEALRRRIAELEQAQTGATHTLASTKPSSIIVDQATFDLVTVGANAGKYLERDVRIVTTGDQRQWVERLVLQPLSLHCEGSTPDSESQTTIIDTPFRIIRQGDHRGKFVQQLEEAGNLLVRDGNTYVAWKMRNEVVMSL